MSFMNKNLSYSMKKDQTIIESKIITININ